ncbi:restriction endonuclease subunit S [Pseudarthrobacter sp. NPDC058119]|uniref:restriction endonuclease subunit S n=1 Tax=Pseudarthrobacter sp. NPDC058119 TaxID=3346348 RepID=UPI0036DA9994
MSQAIPKRTIGSITTWYSGGTPNRSRGEYWNGNIPWISAFTLKDSEISTSNQFLTAQGVEAGSRMAPIGSTLLLVRGSALHKEIRAGMVVEPVAFNQDVKALVPKRGLVPKYLTHVIRANESELLKLVTSAGNTAGVLDTKVLQSFEIYFPSESEQQVLAKAFDDVDNLIASLERLTAKKQAIKQGIMYQLLTGRTRFPGHVGRWSRVTVGDVADVKTGPFGSALHESDYVAAGTPIITVEHLGERRVNATNAPMVSESDSRRLGAYRLKLGDVVFSRVGSIDRNSLISDSEEGWLFSGRLLRVRFDQSQADPAFMSAQFHAKQFREAVRTVAVGQTMPSLNTAILRNISIDLPPLAEQIAIGKVHADLNRELDVLECRLAKARNIRQGMMQELLTGRTLLSIGVMA